MATTTARKISQYSAAIRGGLIEALDIGLLTRPGRWYSAAIRGGLIEACQGKCLRCSVRIGIPPRFAAASLKPRHRRRVRPAHADTYSAAIRGGLIEAERED